MSRKVSNYLSSDVPKEGFKVKMIEALLSPSESETEYQIASAEPQYIQGIREEIGQLKTSSISKMRSFYSMSSLRSLTSMRSVEESGMSLTNLVPGSKEMEIRLNLTARDIFGQYIKPNDILHLFHFYDPDVLTDQDIEDIRELTETCGNKVGALELYDRLQKYSGWLPCLLSVLRDPNINMGLLADLLLSYFALEKAANKVFNNPDNQEKLVQILKSQLKMLLHPLKILHLFHKYDPNVLVQSDLDDVRKLTRETNDETGTELLLDRLVLYPGWYPCLMKVLQDKECGLGYMVDILSDIFAREFSEISKVQKRAQKKLLSQLKDRERMRKQRIQSSASTISTVERVKTESEKRHEEWIKLLKESKDCPRYSGLDWNKPLKPHKRETLPSEGDLCDQYIQYIHDRDICLLESVPGLHGRMFDPCLEGEKYVEKFAITELLTFMLCRLILNKPARPMDFLIDMVREINRLDTIRRQVELQTKETKSKVKIMKSETLHPHVDQNVKFSILSLPAINEVREVPSNSLGESQSSAREETASINHAETTVANN